MSRKTAQAVDMAVEIISGRLKQIKKRVAKHPIALDLEEAVTLATALADIEAKQRASNVAEGHLLLAALVGKKSIDALPIAQRAHVLRQLTGIDAPEAIDIPKGEAADE